MMYFKETNADSLIKRPIFLVISSQLFLLYNFSKFLYIFTLFIHPSTLNITDITPLVLMMVQQNRNAIVSTLFLYKSPLSIWITCYQFVFTNCRITIHYFLPYTYIKIYIYIYIYIYTYMYIYIYIYIYI